MGLQKCRRDVVVIFVSTTKKSSNSSGSAAKRSTVWAGTVLFRTPGIWNRRPEELDDRHCHRALRGYPASSVQSAVQEKCDDLRHVHHYGGSPQRLSKGRSPPRPALSRNGRHFMCGKEPPRPFRKAPRSPRP